MFLTVCVVLVILLFMYSIKSYRLRLAKLLFILMNFIESRLARLRSNVISLDGLTVHYLSNVDHFSKHKPTLVLLHGFSADKFIWNRFARRFTKNYQLLIPDLKGHGENAYHPNANYSVPSQCDMLLKLIGQLKVKKASLIGNSMGGMMAAKLVDEFPNRFDKCVLIDPAGAKSEFAKNMVKNNFNPFDHQSEQDFFKFYDLIMAKPPYIPKFILQALASEYIDKRLQYGHMFSDFFNLKDFYASDYRFEFTEAMLIWGLNDKLLPVDDYTQWKNMLNTNSQIYEDLGHMPMIEDVKQVSKDILIFLRG